MVQNQNIYLRDCVLLSVVYSLISSTKTHRNVNILETSGQRRGYLMKFMHASFRFVFSPVFDKQVLLDRILSRQLLYGSNSVKQLSNWSGEDSFCAYWPADSSKGNDLAIIIIFSPNSTFHQLVSGFILHPRSVGNKYWMILLLNWLSGWCRRFRSVHGFPRRPVKTAQVGRIRLKKMYWSYDKRDVIIFNDDASVF